MSHMVIYIESHLLCILFLSVLLVINLKHWRPRYINSLSAIYLFTIFSSVLDIAWILLEGTNRFRWLYHLVNIVYLSGFEFIAFFWLDYCAGTLPFRLWKNKRQRFAYMLPAVIITLLIITSAFTGWIYGIDAGGAYYRGSGFFIQPMGYLYLFVASGLALKARSGAQFAADKRKYTAMALFPLPSLLLGVLQLLMPPGGLPTMQFSIFLALLIFFVTFLENNVTQDSLTGLSNRYALDRALDSRINGGRRNRAEDMYLLLGDLDEFKSINDNFGHMEGDRALRITANTLKHIFGDSSAVLARMGGDEFAVILETDSPTLAQMAIRQIARELDKMSESEPYRLSMSIGMAKYAEGQTVTEFFKRADHALYQIKRNRAIR